MKKILNQLNVLASNPIVKIGLFFALICFLRHVNAADLLAGTDTDITDTMKGTGKHWAYIIEGIIALGIGIKTRNVYAFFGVLAVAVFINVLLFLIAPAS